MPPSLLQAIGLRLAEPHPQFDTVIKTHDVQRIYISRRADDALAQAKANRKILQVLRCRHHHCIGPTVIGERHRGLFRDRASAGTETGMAPYLAINDRSEERRVGKERRS